MAWVDCSTGGSFFGGWTADLGLWTGEWPLQAPTATDGLSEGDEIDYVVGLPNPSDPTNPYVALDGSYPAQLWQARRQLSGPDIITYASYGRGGMSAPSGSDVPPAAAHLYVVILASFGEPTSAPETYAPATYAVGGLAPEPAGHWSDWQTGFTLTMSVSADIGSAFDDAHDGSSYPSPSIPLTNRLAHEQHVITSSASASVSGLAAGAILKVSVDRNPPDIIDTTGHTLAELTLDQFTAEWDAAPYNPYPTPLDSLTEGVDYAPAPFIDIAWEYESPDPVDHEWVSALTVEAGGQWTVPRNGSGLDADNAYTNIRIDVLDGPVADGDVGPYGQAVIVGTQIASIPVRSDDGAEAPADPGFDGAFGNFYTVIVPRDLPASFTLAAVMELAAEVVPPDSGIGLPTVGRWDQFASPDFSAADGPGGYEWTASFKFGTDDSTALDFTWTTSQWRYWVPVASDLVWHTAGGHWATPGGEIMRILTPGRGWVPIEDGPG